MTYLTHFLAMGGYARYVWSSYAIVLVSFFIYFTSTLLRLNQFYKTKSSQLEPEPMKKAKISFIEVNNQGS